MWKTFSGWNSRNNENLDLIQTLTLTLIHYVLYISWATQPCHLITITNSCSSLPCRLQSSVRLIILSLLELHQEVWLGFNAACVGSNASTRWREPGSVVSHSTHSSSISPAHGWRRTDFPLCFINLSWRSSGQIHHGGVEARVQTASSRQGGDGASWYRCD